MDQEDKTMAITQARPHFFRVVRIGKAKHMKYRVYARLFGLALLTLVTQLACADIYKTTAQRNTDPDRSPLIQEYLISRRSGLAKTEPINLHTVALQDLSRIIAVSSGISELLSFDRRTGEFSRSKSFASNSRPLNSIYIVDSTTAFVLGGGALFKTQDGGISWKEIEVPSTLNFTAMTFSDGADGYLVAEKMLLTDDSVSHQLEIFLTQDAGMTWKKIYFLKDVKAPVFDIASVSPSNLCLIIGGRHLLRTENFGKSWEETLIPVNSSGTAFGRDKRGFLVNGTSDIYTSEDLGRSWKQLADQLRGGETCKWNSIETEKNGQGIATASNGCIAFTYDGDQWRTYPQKFENSIEGVTLRDRIAIAWSSSRIYQVEF